MSFEIQPTETFWTVFRELPLSAQEAVLDVMEAMRDHPGDMIDRKFASPLRAAVTRLTHVETEDRSLSFAIAFQYDSDEETIHMMNLVIILDKF